MSFAEVDQALHAPPGMRYEQRLGDVLVMIIGMAESGRVILVLCEQVERTTTFDIVRVKLPEGQELDDWRKRVL